ncbi:MAG: hypothetical protein Q7T36_12690 [Fluviicoccus sp.]|uniref:hypothetical protein n=1 Tax=Fluviicoccus sp. TaxID=2003552 RepID=UPI00271DF956|nr:hypothetical protein [Fluviicoccus sp.]MDO8331318.1 hypothetical protein [Fluviicoccus sp.]
MEYLLATSILILVVVIGSAANPGVGDMLTDAFKTAYGKYSLLLAVMDSSP